jgi:hypothetical protein
MKSMDPVTYSAVHSLFGAYVSHHGGVALVFDIVSEHLVEVQGAPSRVVWHPCDDCIRCSLGRSGLWAAE